MTATENTILDRIQYLKREVVPEGSIIAYCYNSEQVELIESGKYIYGDDDGPKLKPSSSKVKGYLSGDNGVVLSRYIQGQWCDRPVSIEVLQQAFGKKG